MYQTDTHRGFLVDIRICRRLVIDVIPLKKRSAMTRLLIIGQIIAHHAAHVKIIRKLESEHWVVDFTQAYLFNVFLGTHRIGILVIVRDTSAEHNGFQVQLLAKLLAVIVHSACQPEPTVFGMDKHLDAIKDIPFRVVGIERLVPRHFSVSMIPFHHIVIDNNRKGTSYDFVICHGHNLPFGENGYQFLYLGTCPEHVFIGIHPCERLCQLVVILHPKVTDFHLIDFMCLLHKFLLIY